MSDRARATYPRMRQIAVELSEAGIDLPMIVKLGYRIDGGKEKDREHMWFEVHDLGERTVEPGRLHPAAAGPHPDQRHGATDGAERLAQGPHGGRGHPRAREDIP